MAFEVRRSSDYDFFIGSGKIYAFTESKKTVLSVPQPWWTEEVTPAHERFVLAWRAYEDPDNRTKLITAEKNDSRGAYEPLVSKTIEFLRGNANVSDAQERALDIYLEPHSSTPTPTTTKYPEIHVELDVIRRITGHFRIFGESGNGKPDGVGSIEFTWAILDEEPRRVEELIHHNVDLYTRNSFLLDFENDERGKRVYMAARYVMRSSASGYGPWGEMTYAVIP
jgi:hypothetical protein